MGQKWPKVRVFEVFLKILSLRFSGFGKVLKSAVSQEKIE